MVYDRHILRHTVVIGFSCLIYCVCLTSDHITYATRAKLYILIAQFVPRKIQTALSNSALRAPSSCCRELIIFYKEFRKYKLKVITVVLRCDIPVVQDFIKANNLPFTPTDPTKTYQTAARKTINSSKILIPQDNRWKYINMNPTAPTIKGLIKLHKQDQPIRPVVNWRNALF